MHTDTCAHMPPPPPAPPPAHRWNTLKKRLGVGAKHLYSTFRKTKINQTQKKQVVTEKVEKHSKRQENDAVYPEKLLLKYSKN